MISNKCTKGTTAKNFLDKFYLLITSFYYVLRNSFLRKSTFIETLKTLTSKIDEHDTKLFAPAKYRNIATSGCCERATL